MLASILSRIKKQEDIKEDAKEDKDNAENADRKLTISKFDQQLIHSIQNIMSIDDVAALHSLITTNTPILPDNEKSNKQTNKKIIHRMLWPKYFTITKQQKTKDVIMSFAIPLEHAKYEYLANMTIEIDNADIIAVESANTVLTTHTTRKLHVNKLSETVVHQFTSIAHVDFDFFTNLTDHHDHRLIVVFARFASLPMQMPKITMQYDLITIGQPVLDALTQSINEIVALHNITAAACNLSRLRDEQQSIILTYNIAQTSKLSTASNRLRVLMGLPTDYYYDKYSNISMPTHIYSTDTCQYIDKCLRQFASIDNVIDAKTVIHYP